MAPLLYVAADLALTQNSLFFFFLVSHALFFLRSDLEAPSSWPTHSDIISR